MAYLLGPRCYAEEDGVFVMRASRPGDTGTSLGSPLILT